MINRLWLGRCSQSMSLGCYILPLRRHRSRRARCWLCTRYRISAHGQASLFRVRCCRCFKFETVVPEAFRAAAAFGKGKIHGDPASAVRHACRDAFRRANVLARLIPSIDEMLAAGELPVPEPPPEAVAPAFENSEASGDVGHRS